MNDKFFELKVLCFVLGAGCGVAGMFTEKHWLVRVGIGFLAAGILLRLISRKREEEVPMINDSRQHLLDALEGHKPSDQRETEALAFILNFVRTHDDPFSRKNLDAHVTASGFMMHESEARTLLVWHTKLQRWLQPGGHVEADDPNVYEAARREGEEETGHEALDGPHGAQILDVDVHTIPERPGAPEHKHLDIRFAFIAGKEVGKADHGLKWVARDEIPSLNLDAAAVRALDKAFSLKS